MKNSTVERLMKRLEKIKVHISGHDFRYFMQYFVHPFTFFFVSYSIETELGYTDINSINTLKEKSQKIIDDIIKSNIIEHIIFFHRL